MVVAQSISALSDTAGSINATCFNVLLGRSVKLIVMENVRYFGLNGAI